MSLIYITKESGSVYGEGVYSKSGDSKHDVTAIEQSEVQYFRSPQQSILSIVLALEPCLEL